MSRTLANGWPRLPRLVLACGLAVSSGCGSRPAAGGTDTGTISIVIGAEPTLPLPTLSSAKANTDVASLLFLPLARPGPDLATADESSFVPVLARSWTRLDSVTIAFDLDPRARWHDGTPVTSRDVVWSLERARDSLTAPTLALLLRDLASVTADGPERVVVGFRRAYAEQLYDAVYHAVPLPAHLLDTIPLERLAASPLATQPVGNGPYRWGGLEPGQRLDLVAVPDFFLGAPRLTRVALLFVRAAEAQLNLMLDGTADAFEAFLLPRQIEQLAGQTTLRVASQPSLGAGYLLFNQKAYGDRRRPHPILADPVLRRAIASGVDRERLLRTVFGDYATRIDGPMGGASWVRRVTPPAPGYDPTESRRLLAAQGWRDHDGDGILEKNGTRLALRLSYPGSSIPRVNSAEIVQSMLREIGVEIELLRLDGPIWSERRSKGQFDIDFSQTILDPTPSGLVQSWSCAGIGGSNVGSICDPAFEAALAAALRAGQDADDRWRTAVTALQATTPAVFLFSPTQSMVVHTRYRDVSVRPDLAWAELWRWSVDPAQRLARDEP